MSVQLPNDLLLRITWFANRPTLLTLCFVSRLFAYSSELHQRLFALEHPNLNITAIQPTSWEVLRVQRAIAERNLLHGVFWKELIFTLPQNAYRMSAQVFQERQFITYWTKNPSAFAIYEVHKKKTLSFPTPHPSSNMYCAASLEEMGDGLHVSISCEDFNENQPKLHTFFLLKVDDEALTEVQRYTSNDFPSSYRWIFCKELNFFRLAMTVKNRLQILTTPTSCKTEDFDKRVYIAEHLFLDNHSLLMLYFRTEADNLITVYNSNTLKECFGLKLPWKPSKEVKVLLQDRKLTVFSGTFRMVCDFEIPSFPETTITYQNSRHFRADAPRPIYLNAKMCYIADGSHPDGMLRHNRLSLAAPNSFTYSPCFVFQFFTILTPCESQGLPTLLAQDGGHVYVLNFVPPKLTDCDTETGLKT